MVYRFAARVSHADVASRLRSIIVLRRCSRFFSSPQIAAKSAMQIANEYNPHNSTPSITSPPPVSSNKHNKAMRYHCVWCGDRFPWYQSLKEHLKYFGEQPHRKKDWSIHLTEDDLNDHNVFCDAQRADFLTRTVSLDAYEEIARSGSFVGSYSSSAYDGPLVAPEEEITRGKWPRAIYFELQSIAEGGVIFPSRRYPKDAEPGAPVKIAKVPLDVLADERYRMFHIQTSSTQLGGNATLRVHTNVVFAREDRWEWLRGHGAVEMNKSENSILYHRDDGQYGRWYMASRFNGKRKYGERLTSRPLSINIVFLDALTTDSSWTWRDGFKMRVEYEKGFPHFCCSFCSHRTRGMEKFKHHYLMHHADVDPKCYKDQICDICGYATHRRDHLRKHIETHLRSPVEKNAAV